MLSSLTRCCIKHGQTRVPKSRSLRLISDNWPLTRSVDQGQHPNGFAANFVHQAIAFMRHQLSGSLDFSLPSQFRMSGKPGRRIAEKLIHTRGSSRIVGRDEVPNVSAIL